MIQRLCTIAALTLCLTGAGVVAKAESYLDDRSSAERVVASLYNALNAGEYSRAWSYYAPGAHPVGSYSAFVKGYAETSSVQLRTGPAVEDAGMSKLYSAVPVALRAVQTDGSVQSFTGCYLLLQIAAGVQDPPFRPIEIIGAKLQKASSPVGAVPPRNCDPAAIPRYSK